MKLLLILLGSLLFFTGFMMPKNYGELSRGEQLVNINLAKTAHIIQKKYHITPSGEGAAMPGGPIRLLCLSFDTNTLYTKEKLRELLINCAQELIDQVNSNEEIQPFLFKVPFTTQNIQITIYNHNVEGMRSYDPEIATAGISRGILTYRTIDPQDDFKIKNEFQETYEEALKALSTH